MLARNPSFSLFVTALVAIGVGVNTTVFAVLSAYLLRPLPYERSDEIVIVQGRDREGNVYNASHADYRDWQRVAASFEELSCYGLRDQTVKVTADNPFDRCGVAFVSGNFFRMFHARPAIGRLLSEEDDHAAAIPTVVLSHNFWQHYFGSDSNVIGRSILLNGVSHVIVGATHPTFQFPPYGGWAKADVWVATDPAMYGTGRENPEWYFAIGRLRKGVSIQQAQADMEAVSAGLLKKDPSRKLSSATVTRLHDWMTGSGSTWQVFYVMMGTVLLVFIVTCANVAGLVFARGVARGHEIAIRSALGASRLGLIRLMLVENLALALLGGSLGVLGAMWTIQLLAQTDMFLATRIPADFLRPDWRVFVFALALSTLAVPIFGLFPSVSCSGMRLARATTAASRTVLGSRRRNVLHSGLLGAQVAVTIVLLVTAALMMRSLVKMVTDDLGFNPKNILVMDFELTDQKYSSPDSAVSFYRQLLGRLRAVPGIEKAGIDGGKGSTALCVEGEPAPPPDRTVMADYRTVSPGYFETMQIPLLRGRRFDERDQIGSGPVVIVDQTLAERYWPDANPIGKRIQLRRSANPNVPWFEIIGIVGHVKGSGIKENWRMQVYRPLLQKASHPWGSIVIRTVADPKDFITTVRSAVYQIDHEQLVCDPRTMEDILWWRFITNRAITSFLTVFAGIALCLSAAGIYAITRYSVSRRTQEFGLRMALGASRSSVLRLVLRKSLIPVQVGAGIGLVGTVAVAQVLSSLLYQISPWDPLTYVAVCVLLAGVAVLASYLPARRAAKIDPMGALRYE